MEFTHIELGREGHHLPVVPPTPGSLRPEPMEARQPGPGGAEEHFIAGNARASVQGQLVVLLKPNQLRFLPGAPDLLRHPDSVHRILNLDRRILPDVGGEEEVELALDR